MADVGKGIVFCIVYDDTTTLAYLARERCFNTKCMWRYLEIKRAQKRHDVVVCLELLVS